MNDEILDAFFEAANASDGDLVVALVRSETILKRFPAAKRTYLRFRDGHFSGANLFLVRSEAALRAIEFWKRAEQHRKQPWRIVREFGLGALVAFALGRLDLDAAFARASQVVGARVTPVVLPMAEAAVDVDKLSDLELVRDLLSQSPSAAS